MSYLITDTIQNNIHNGEYAKAFEKLLERLEKLENKCKNMEAYLNHKEGLWNTNVKVNFDGIGKEQDQ